MKAADVQLVCKRGRKHADRAHFYVASMHFIDMNVRLENVNAHQELVIVRLEDIIAHLEHMIVHLERVNAHLELENVNLERVNVHLDDVNACPNVVSVHPEAAKAHLGTLNIHQENVNVHLEQGKEKATGMSSFLKDDIPVAQTPRCLTIVSCGNYLHTTRCNRAVALE